jgi:hypothetical protein
MDKKRIRLRGPPFAIRYSLFAPLRPFRLDDFRHGMTILQRDRRKRGEDAHDFNLPSLNADATRRKGL